MIGIYCRRSNKHLEKQVSIEIQTEQGIAFANSIGQPYRIFTDAGITGTMDEIEDRPEFAALMQAIDKKQITGVWVLEQARLERNPKIWQLFQFLVVKREVKFYPNGKETDLNDPQIRLMTGIISLTNEMYAKMTGKRVKDTHFKNVSNGKGVGMSAFGYTQDDEGYLIIDEAQKPIVERIFKMSLSGIGTYTIAKTLNLENVPTKYNSYEGMIRKKESYTQTITNFDKKEVKWRGNVIHDMLINPIYKGMKRWNDGFVPSPVIIDETLWDKVNANLRLNKKNVGKKETYNYLLKGIIFCDNCGLPMHGKKRLKGKDSAYKCNHTDKLTMGCRGISIVKLETFLIRHLFMSKDLKKLLLEQPETSGGVSGYRKKLVENQKKLETIERQIQKAYDLLLDEDFENDDTVKSRLKSGKIERDRLIKIVTELETKVAELESSTRKQRVSNLIGEYALNSDFNTTKRLVHSLVSRIGLYHGTRENGKNYFLIDVNYSGFNEKSRFMTDYQANKFSWLHHNNGEDDMRYVPNEFTESYATFPDMEKVKPFHAPMKMLSRVILEKQDLLDFG